jgi:hypothetical protein
MADFTTLEIVFAVCAAAGAAGFLLWAVLQLTGLGHHDLGAAHGDVGGVGDHGDLGDGTSDVSFKVLSLQGTTAFLLMFGLVGLALSRSGIGVAAILGAAAAGAASVAVIARLFRAARRLQSSGTIHLASAEGQEGTVYLSIPAGGTGKVHVAVQERLLELDAVAEDAEEIRTGERVRVARVVGENAVAVTRVPARIL